MCRSVDRELLASADFCTGLDAAGRGYLVSTGRFALRGIGRAQDLYTLDPNIASDEVVAARPPATFSGTGPPPPSSRTPSRPPAGRPPPPPTRPPSPPPPSPRPPPPANTS